MANEFINKVVLANGDVLIDLTDNDIKPEHVDSGIIFTDRTGKKQQGTSTKTVDASNATATADEVLDGESFGKGDKMEKGTMPNRGGAKVEISSKDGTVIPKGYYDGSGKAILSPTELEKLIPSNIKEGVTILDVTGTFGADDISAQAKEVTPSFTEQIVQPTDGYDFLSQVTVKPIPVTRTDNEFGGVTVTIG